MTAPDRAFHEKWIRGVTLKMIWGAALVIVSIIGGFIYGTWVVDNTLTDLKQSVKDGNAKCMQFTKDQVSGLRIEMNAKFDTIKINQIQFNYNTRLEIQKARADLQGNQLRRPMGLVTEKKVGGKITFVPYDNNNNK
jgi:hypothetical protein